MTISPSRKRESDPSEAHHRPAVHIEGNAAHPDFRDVLALAQRDAALLPARAAELIIVFQDRPGSVCARQADELRRQAPLAGVVAVAGSWCEGETRTGRPLPGASRMYWHEFPAWWRRQMALVERGLCPEWARPGEFAIPATARKLLDFGELSRAADCGLKLGQHSSSGTMAIAASCWDTADALADVLGQAGYATVWAPSAAPLVLHGVTAGVWEGGQLDPREADELADFSLRMARQKAPVVAILDFPRRDRVDRALKAGAAAVLGKPWSNAALVETLQSLLSRAGGGSREGRKRAA